MKYVIVIPDGAADEPQESLGGKTPLEAAHTPNMDRVAAMGVVARACHTPPALPAGSEIGNLSLLGYNPLENFTGRAPMEAAAQGIELGPSDWAIRCNLVTVEDQVMRDFTADHITTEEAHASCWRRCRKRSPAIRSFAARSSSSPGVSYRNLLIWRGDKLAAPFIDERHAHTAAARPHRPSRCSEDYPRGPGSDVLTELMDRQSRRVPRPSGERRSRQGYGKRPATNVWLWGLGQAPQLRPFDRAVRRRGRDDHGGRPAPRHRGPGRLGPDRSARGDRLLGHRLRRQGPLRGRRARRSTISFACTSRRPTKPRTKAAATRR